MRHLPDWIEYYMRYQENTEPARVFDKWAAYSVVACALRKKAYLSLGRIKIFPNIYTVFVAEPGVARKSQAISYAMGLLSNIPEINVSADAITKEAMVQDLEKRSTEDLMPDGSSLKHSSLCIFSKEFETFLGQKKENTKMLVLLTDLFDCQELPWVYRTKGSGTNVVPSVFLNMLAATTPESLASSLPSTAVGGGLTSRILFVWADKKKKKVPRPTETEEELQMKEDLLKDLFVMSRIAGQYAMSSSCIKKWDEWYEWYEETDPNRICRDPSFNGWYSRKPMYALKIAMLIAASRSNRLTVEWVHIEKALSELEEVETGMGYAFKAIGKSLVTSETDTVLQIVKTRGSVDEKTLLSMVWRDIDSQKFNIVIETAIRAGKVIRAFKGPKGEFGVWYHWGEPR